MKFDQFLLKSDLFLIFFQLNVKIWTILFKKWPKNGWLSQKQTK